MTSIRFELHKLLSRFYVPVVSVLALLIAGNWFAGRGSFDPLSAAQNPRLLFGTGSNVVATASNGLDPGEVALAAAVVDGKFGPAANHPELLYLGNSQTLAIIDADPGDLISPQWLQVFLHRAFGSSDAPAVVLGSLPNLSMCEFLLRLVEAGEWRPNPVRAMVGCLTLREWRGMAVRDQSIKEAKNPIVARAIAGLIESNPDLRFADAALRGALEPKHQTADSATDNAGLAARMESSLQAAADQVPLFRERPQLYASLALDYNVWRDRALGIRTDTPRPVPAATYHASLQLLELALRYARAHGIKVVLYLSPIRPLEPNPTLPSDLERFRTDVPRLCKEYGATCLDYTHLIPEHLWTNYPDGGINQGQRDYAHFTGAAHELLAKHLMSDVGPELSAWLR